MIRDLENNLINLRNGVNAHRLLLGKTGSGKTWFCYRMLEDALAQEKTCLIFDYSGSFTDQEMRKGDFQRLEQVYSVAEETANGKFMYVVLERLHKQGIEIERFTHHAFRDTFATRYIEEGGNMKTLQMILGHSSLAMTADLYTHVLSDTKQQEMKQIENGFIGVAGV